MVEKGKVALGRLERVDLRTAWTDEARDFTPWLAREESIQLLGDAIGLDLEVDSQEKSVGPYRADILCRETTTDHLVLIENQLERTDHTHLGQLLTYAAGLQAVTVVWIARQFTDEHRAALDWLNSITGPTINFFGLEVELWRIGNSPVAPKFNVVSQPNDWSKTVKQSADAASGGTTDAQRLHLEFWTRFRSCMQERGGTIRVQKPLPQHWTIIALGTSYFWLSPANNTREGRSSVTLVMAGPNAKAYFHLLKQQHAAQVAALLPEAEWRELPHRKESHIVVGRESNLTEREGWPDLLQWFATTVERMESLFRPLLKTLDLSDYVSAARTSGSQEVALAEQGVSAHGAGPPERPEGVPADTR